MILLLPLSRYKQRALRQEEPDLSGYPKAMKLRDGTSITLRPMQPGDSAKLLEFFQGLKPRARLFLKDDVTDPKVIQDWEENLDYSRVIPILAFHGGKIIGDASLHRNVHGWSRHVAEIRMVTAHAYRRKGLGYLLARELYFLAQRLQVDKVLVQVMSTQKGAMKIFEKIGFRQEAVLKNAVMDQREKKHHLIIMSQDLTVLWQRIEDLVHDMEDHGG